MSRKRGGLATALAALLLLAAAPAWASGDGFAEHWYKASVNHVTTRDWILIITRNGHRYIRRLDMIQLGLPTPHMRPIRHASEPYYPVAAIPWLDLYIDRRGKRIYLVDNQRPAVAKAPDRTLLLDTTVDGRHLPNPLYFRYQDGKLLVPAATAQAMGLRATPGSKSLPQRAVSMSELTGGLFSLDYRKLTLKATVPPQLLRRHVLSMNHAEPAHPTIITRATEQLVGRQAPSHHQVGAVLSYDVAEGYRPGSGRWHSGIYSAALGESTASCRTRYLNAPEQPYWRRLGSSCDFDWPGRMLSLSLGDSIAGGTGVTSPVRYGGLRFGTDFGLQPSLITLPTSQISGTARVPSTLEVWIDQMLALRSDVPPGPFVVHNIPLHAGSGTLKATLVSPTGQRQVVAVTPFYADSSLLAPGLSDWSVDIGKLRENFASPADHYAQPFGAAHLRYGVSDFFTPEVAFQASKQFQLGLAGAAFRLGSFAALDFSVARSRNRHGEGGSAVRARLSRIGRHFTFSYLWQRATHGYQELAYPAAGSAPETLQQISLGFPLGGGVTFSASDYRESYFDGSRVGLFSGSLNVGLGILGHLTLSAFRLAGHGAPWMYSAQLTVPFGERSDVSAWSQRGNGRTSEHLEVQMNPPAGPGFGYRVDAGHDGHTNSLDGEVQMQNDSAELDLEAQRYGGEKSGTARLAGSVLLSGDGVDFARNQPGSYAVVRVGIPGVPVYRDGQRVAVSDPDGDALVPGLRPYERNRISVHGADLPLDVQPKALKAMIKPGRREIMDVDFDFQHTRYITGRLRLAGRRFVPAGARLVIGGSKASSVVGRRGRFFIETPQTKRLLLIASWHGHSCTVHELLHNKPGSGPVQRAGALKCRETQK